MQQLELVAYEPAQSVSLGRQTTYFVVGDLESLSASALYYGEGNVVMPGEIGSAGSGFKLAPKLKLGPGIARTMEEAAGMIERVRKDNDKPSHLNYEYLVPGIKTATGTQKFITLANLHIDLED